MQYVKNVSNPRMCLTLLVKPLKFRNIMIISIRWSLFSETSFSIKNSPTLNYLDFLAETKFENFLGKDKNFQSLVVESNIIGS